MKLKVVPGGTAPAKKWRDGQPAEASQNHQGNRQAFGQGIDLNGIGLSRQRVTAFRQAAICNSIASENGWENAELES